MRSVKLMSDISPLWLLEGHESVQPGLSLAFQPHHGVGCLPSLLKEFRTCHMQTSCFGALIILS